MNEKKSSLPSIVIGNNLKIFGSKFTFKKLIFAFVLLLRVVDGSQCFAGKFPHFILSN